ncbi:MAG: toprim domain-containing protein [Sumerlaeia bacterium]
MATELRHESLRLPILPTSRDRQGVMRRFSFMKPTTDHPYLASRGITESLLTLPPFCRKVMMDDRRNAVFPHEDEEGICGYEIKNKAFTGFAAGGKKGLWSSVPQKGDTDIVIVESAIDALSYAALFQRSAIYVSTAGAWNPKTPSLLEAKAKLLPRGGKIILAFDHDPQGKAYELQARYHLQSLGYEMVSHFPETSGSDWNDVLRLRLGRLHLQYPSIRPEIDQERGERGAWRPTVQKMENPPPTVFYFLFSYCQNLSPKFAAYNRVEFRGYTKGIWYVENTRGLCRGYTGRFQKTALLRCGEDARG